MRIEELLSIVVAVAGLVGMGVVLGAVIMWRLVHMKANPPPLPPWVWITEIVSVALVGVAAWIAGQLLLLVSMALLMLLGILQLTLSLRARARPG